MGGGNAGVMFTWSDFITNIFHNCFCFSVEINPAHIITLIPETLTSSVPNIASVFIKDFVEKRIICPCVDSKSPLKKQ